MDYNNVNNIFIILGSILILITNSHQQFDNSRVRFTNSPQWRHYDNSDPRWVRIDTPYEGYYNPQSRHINRYPKSAPEDIPDIENFEQDRKLRPNTITTISETLGALNTIGRYLVNATRNRNFIEPAKSNHALPDALYTISKNVLGQNVTDTIAPYIKEAIPMNPKPEREVRVDHSKAEASTTSACVTPEGEKGVCDDLSNCPQLLLNLGNLRQSLCFKSLFVPGVCCPIDEIENVVSTQRPIVQTTFLKPQTTVRPHPPPIIIPATTTTTNKPITTQRPYVHDNTLPINPEDCGQSEESSFRVVGGEEALPGRWPWMAAIFLHGPRRTEFWCGGSLITERHVLTAAHCTRDTRQRPFSPRQFTVRLGDIDLKRDDEPSAPITVGVNEIRAHPQFSRVGFYNDIALVYLDRPVRKSKYTIPLCLPKLSRSDLFNGHQSTVVGWGTTYYGGKESTVQRQASLPVWRNEDCNQAYFQPITDNFICAGYSQGGVDACQGDSGGPLMLQRDGRWIQIGIVSFGNKCGEPGYPGVFTRVTKYIDWIEENIR